MFTILTFRHSLLRSMLGIVLGLLFIMWPQESITYLVIITGIFFTLSGACSFLVWRLRRDKSAAAFSPLLVWSAVLGSMVLGVWLALLPGFFVNVFGRIWGVILIIAGIQQLVSLFKARERRRTPFGCYILPVLILLSGLMVAAYPAEAVAGTFVLVGVAGLFYGLNELASWYAFRPPKAELRQEEVGDEGAKGAPGGV
jgi:uncharacterized membrane protein HdeD (DUF308 family)